MRLAAKLVAGLGCLLGSEIALLPFGHLEERVGNSFGLATHCTNIQRICINVQQWNFKFVCRADGSAQITFKQTKARVGFPALLTPIKFMDCGGCLLCNTLNTSKLDSTIFEILCCCLTCLY